MEYFLDIAKVLKMSWICLLSHVEYFRTFSGHVCNFSGFGGCTFRTFSGQVESPENVHKVQGVRQRLFKTCSGYVKVLRMPANWRCFFFLRTFLGEVTIPMSIISKIFANRFQTLSREVSVLIMSIHVKGVVVEDFKAGSGEHQYCAFI